MNHADMPQMDHSNMNHADMPADDNDDDLSWLDFGDEGEL